MRRIARLEDVAGTADGVDEFDVAVAIDDAAQPSDVDLDEIRERIELFVPDMFGDLLAPHHASRIDGEIFEQRVFLGRQLQLAASARAAMRARVEAQIADLDHRILPRAAPPKQRAQAGQQLGKLERFYEIV